ncbi:MAG: DNA cytosine methyltransferase [Acidimicrobiales bacterium]|nr:DNA cytosine methyltransferase [Acidimicrobiales bacterium]MYB80809.1 DNA cytosine methyltransferase [Acidimicrobiales bacterium]MYI11097.1 DNA cytosine methyltransferase [Acidimicrobiales bacterium]
MSQPSVAEFFAGIGLVRSGMEAAGFKVVWANDISPMKQAVYAANFGADHYHLCDVRDIRGDAVPEVDVATASFPCIDLSLAGHRRGLAGEQSGLYFEFVRVLAEMGERRPAAVLIENVPSFISSRGGRDLHDALASLNRLGYVCDLAIVDSRWFVPQSRKRLFVLGWRDIGGRAGAPSLSVVQGDAASEAMRADTLRPPSLRKFLDASRHLELAQFVHGCLPSVQFRLADVVEHLGADDERWWDERRLAAFDRTLPKRHETRIAELEDQNLTTWRTAYRRTRGGRAVWEVRADEIAGCLRTARGGSSRQALVEMHDGTHRVRWMTAREYGRLQGVSDEFDISPVTESQALFGFGDAVTVPVIAWIADNFLVPALGPMTAVAGRAA